MGGTGFLLLAPAGFALWAWSRRETWLRANNYNEELIEAIREGFPVAEENADE